MIPSCLQADRGSSGHVYGAGLPLASIGDPFGTGEILMGRFTARKLSAAS
jgi:hypothetical protein